MANLWKFEQEACPRCAAMRRFGTTNEAFIADYHAAGHEIIPLAVACKQEVRSEFSRLFGDIRSQRAPD